MVGVPYGMCSPVCGRKVVRDGLRFMLVLSRRTWQTALARRGGRNNR